MPWAQENPSGKFCTFGLKTGFWLAYLCQLQFFHLLPGMGSVFHCSKQQICNSGQQWLLGCREIQSTGPASTPTQGRWQIQDKIRKFHFSMKCNSTAIRGGEAGKWEDHTWIENTENPILPSWRRFCLPLNPGFRLGLERANKPVWTMFPCRNLGFSGVKVLEGRAAVSGQCTLVRQPGDDSDAPKHSQPEILSTGSPGWQHLRAVLVPCPQLPIWCWCFPAAPSDSVTSQCKLRKSSLKYLKTVQHHTWKQTVQHSSEDF